ncbi:MAG: nitroreductase family protein [Paludibacteraceae bacterium]|nr:nitroreductase family protein [Paludibacteraceae bacterium]
MALIDTIKSRRSTRKFTEAPIEAEKLDLILKAALMAPSSKRCTPWHFVVVEDKNDLQVISESREMGSAFVSGAKAAIIVCAEEEKSNVWVEDASIAATFIQLMAEELGLGSCWVQVRNRNKNENETTENVIKSLLNIPEGIRVECVVALGYKGEEKKPFDESKLQLDKIHRGKF